MSIEARIRPAGAGDPTSRSSPRTRRSVTPVGWCPVPMRSWMAPARGRWNCGRGTGCSDSKELCRGLGPARQQLKRRRSECAAECFWVVGENRLSGQRPEGSGRRAILEWIVIRVEWLRRWTRPASSSCGAGRLARRATVDDVEVVASGFLLLPLEGPPRRAIQLLDEREELALGLV